MLHDQEHQSEPTHLQQPSIANNVFLSQNPHCIEASYPNLSANAPLPIDDRYFLPGFQQTFGQRHAQRNQMAQHPNASSQMQCSGIYHMDDMAPILCPISIKATKHRRIRYRNSVKPSLTRHIREKSIYVRNVVNALLTVTDCADTSNVHTGEKQYKCTKCGECFQNISEMREHVRISHTDD
ncbi:hypothetical protein CDAR_321251 [Caerostris darwini]|uniref:C2H2-type domain-containing protein n=1 Tax=Caerostris darwini TaxID=1538125 RepID=A0AAV4SKP3_9ARAC|nr:hypothetical protein CDAR_321251 [Caerostris darwini]